MATDDRVCVVAPTGSGKTVIGSAVASHYRSVCWVAHREELIDQASAALKLWAPHTGRTVITVQSINKPSAHHYDLLVIDEAHHYAADDWSQITSNVKHDRLIGLTATPERGDGKGLASVFDRLVVAATYSELLALGQLVPCRITHPHEDVEGVACHPLKAWKEHGEDALTIAFAPSVKLAEQWTEEFNAAGVASACILGKTESRSGLVDAFRAHSLKVLWNYNVLTEGFDVPEVGCVVLARKMGTAGLYIQAAGRGLRVAPAKAHCRIIDLNGNYRTYGLPTQDWSYSLEGKAIRRNKVEKLRQCIKCGAVCTAWVRECPECHYHTPIRKMKLKIDDQELLEVFDGENTIESAKDVHLAKLRTEQRQLGRTLQWTIGRYKKLFGRVPRIHDATPAEKAKYFQGLTFGMGPAAAHAYRAVFSEWPQRTRR
jgi:superfamily II DNA or RNA helicase